MNGFLFITILSFFVLIFTALVMLKFQLLTVIKTKIKLRKMRRAHSGRVICEEKDCSQISTNLTPNGYFCDWHWEPRSVRKIEGGGSVRWNHVLLHSIRRN